MMEVHHGWIEFFLRFIFISCQTSIYTTIMNALQFKDSLTFCLKICFSCNCFLTSYQMSDYMLNVKLKDLPPSSEKYITNN